MSGSRAKSQRKANPSGADYSSVDHAMIRDDVDWLHSIARSVNKTDWEGPLGIVLAPQMARVVHESFEYLLRRRPAVAKSLERQMIPEIAAARHTIKLVDDNQRSIDDILEAFRDIADKHSTYFGRGFDLALFTWQGRPILTSRSAEYQTVASVEAPSVYGTGVEMGQSMARLLEHGLGVSVPPWKKMNLPDPDQLALTDEIASTYYPAAYSRSISVAEKDLLLTVESSLNAFALIERMTGQDFVGPVFRGRLLAVVHAVSSIQTVVSRHSQDSSAVHPDVHEALVDKDLVWFVGQRLLRNRSMHYGIQPALTGIGSNRPMYGIVEAICNESFPDVQARLGRVSALCANALAVWRG